MTEHRRMNTSLTVVAHLTLTALQCCMWRFTADDAYIIMRFARNLSQTGDIVWNIGDSPVEGSSSLLMVLLLVPLFWMGLDAVLVSKLIGMASAHLTLIFMQLAVKRHYPDISHPASAALMLSVIPAYAVHSVAGMETSIYMLLVIAWIVYPRNRLLPLLLCMARIEAVVVVGIILLYSLMNEEKDRKWVLSACSLVAAFHIWRVIYYGSLFSPPMLVKQAVGLQGFFVSFRFLFFLPMFALLAFVSLHSNKITNRESVRLILIFIVLFCVTWLWSPIMGFEFRFVIPSLLPLLILAQPCVSSLLERVVGVALPSGILNRLWHMRNVIPVVFLLVVPLAWADNSYDAVMYKADGMESVYFPLAEWLQEHTEAGDVVAFGFIGVVGFYCDDLVIIDTIGLADAQIASMPSDASYLFSREPRYIILSSSDGDELTLWPGFPQEEAAVAHPTFVEYEPVTVFEFAGKYFYWVFERKEAER